MSKRPKLVSVEVRKGNIQKALKLFKRKVDDSGHLQWIRNNQQYTKPAVARRKQKQQAVREQQKINMFEKMEAGDTSIRIFTKKRKKRR